jgi:hypothetical protein
MGVRLVLGREALGGSREREGDLVRFRLRGLAERR